MSGLRLTIRFYRPLSIVRQLPVTCKCKSVNNHFDEWDILDTHAHALTPDT